MTQGPAEGESLGQRILTARLELSASLRRYVSQDAFGELVGAETPEGTPFRGATVSRWEAGLQEPTITTCLAIARACRRAGVDVDPGWLMGGRESEALAPRPRIAEQMRPVAPPRRRGFPRPQRLARDSEDVE